MSESILEGEAGVGEEIPLGEGLACPECGKRFKNATGLGVHRAKEHGVAGARAGRERAPRPSPQARGKRAADIERLRRELKKDVNAICLLPFMAKGTATNLTNPAVTNIIDEKAEGFADAWVAVAEQNDFVRKNLATLLSGGVWLHAAAQTAALGYVVAVFSGVVPLHPGALMLIPEMGQFTYQQPSPSAPPPAGNGDGPQTEAA